MKNPACLWQSMMEFSIMSGESYRKMYAGQWTCEGGIKQQCGNEWKRRWGVEKMSCPTSPCYFGYACKRWHVMQILLTPKALCCRAFLRPVDLNLLAWLAGNSLQLSILLPFCSSQYFFTSIVQDMLFKELVESFHPVFPHNQSTSAPFFKSSPTMDR